MHMSKNINSPKEINGLKEFNDALEGMGGDVTPSPILIEAANVIRSHQALKEFPYRRHKASLSTHTCLPISL